MKFKTKKQKERYERICPKGIPRYVRVYDNGGLELDGGTADRYTVVFTGHYTHKTSREHWYIGMSGAPFHPQGIGQHGSSPTQIDYPSYGHLGHKIQFNELNDECKKCVMQTYLYLWDFTDDKGNLIG